MKLFDLFEEDSYQPPTIEKGDDILVGKFLNKKAKVAGFKTDDNDQPVLKTNKGDQRLFKPRIKKLMKESSYSDDITKVLELLQKGSKFAQFRDRIKIFGSVAAGKETPNDVDIMLDYSDMSFDNVVYSISIFLGLSRKYYGSVDVFVKCRNGLFVRNELANGWVSAKFAKKIWNDSQSHGITLDQLAERNSLIGTNLTESSITDNPAFKAWFGKSKAVKDGKPMMFYHGTTKEFRAFDPEHSNTRYDIPPAFFFTNKPDVAQSYAGQSTKDFHFDDDKDEQEYIKAATGGPEDFDRAINLLKTKTRKNVPTWHQGAHVMPVYLRIEKPLRASGGGNNWNEISFEGDYISTKDLLYIAKERGCDSIIVKNVHDRAHGKGKPSTIVAVFSPNQIKSAITNTGAYGSSHNIDEASKEPSLTSAVWVNGKVYTGKTHLDALNKVPLEKRASAMSDGNNRGFVTDRGRYLDRRQGQLYALKHDLFDPAFSWAPSARELTAEVLKKPLQEGVDIFENSKWLTIFRGEYSGNKDGKFWSEDREFAKQFTQTGRDSEVMRRFIHTSDVYDRKPYAYAGDMDAVEAAVATAQQLGYSAVRLSEARGQDDDDTSIYVFNRSALKMSVLENIMVDEITELTGPHNSDAIAGWNERIQRRTSGLHGKGKKVGTIKGDIEVRKYGEDDDADQIFVLILKKKPIGYLELEHRGFGEEIEGWFCEVGLSSEYVGKGIGFLLYKLVISLGYDLVSGYSQTPGSVSLWKKLMADPQITVQGIIEHSDDDAEAHFIDVDQKNPWGSHNIVLYASKRR